MTDCPVYCSYSSNVNFSLNWNIRKLYKYISDIITCMVIHYLFIVLLSKWFVISWKSSTHANCMCFIYIYSETGEKIHTRYIKISIEILVSYYCVFCSMFKSENLNLIQNVIPRWINKRRCIHLHIDPGMQFSSIWWLTGEDN